MQLKKKVTTKFTLTMDENEARVLMDFLGGTSPRDRESLCLGAGTVGTEIYDLLSAHFNKQFTNKRES